MISLSRSQIRLLRVVFRRLSTGRKDTPVVELSAGPDGLRCRCQVQDAAAEFHVAGAFATEALVVPLEALTLCEGRDATPVTFSATPSEGRVEIRWQAAGIPQVREFDAPTQDRPPFPEPADQTTTNEPGLLAALDQAMQTAAKDALRYAVNHVLLRGRTGEVVGTDGKQVLIQGGYRFPWVEDLLVPRVLVFGSKELPEGETVQIGRTQRHVTVCLGPWTVWLAFLPDGRFPPFENVLPAGAGTQVRLDAGDAETLDKALPGLPGVEDDHAPVTVDLNGHVAVRARAAGQSRSTEVLLARSAVVGRPVRVATDRKYLARARELGFDTLTVVDGKKPVVCVDSRRKYGWMLLGKEAIVLPQPDDVRISTADQTLRKADRQEKLVVAVPQASAARRTGKQASSSDTTTSGTSTVGLIEEAEAVQRSLREVLDRTKRLVTAIKLHRKQHRLVRSTLASLKNLHQGAG